MRNTQGFSMVELIVTGAIVAVLCLAAILLYSSFVTDSRKNTVENLAASAASILNTAINVGAAVPSAEIPICLKEYERWTIVLPSGQNSVFICPKGAVITIDTEQKCVMAQLDGKIKSEWYSYDRRE